MFKRRGGGVKGLLNNVKKTALFLKNGFPNPPSTKGLSKSKMQFASLGPRHFKSALDVVPG